MGSVFGCFSSKKNIFCSEDVSRMLAWNRLYGRDSEKVIEEEGYFLGSCLDEDFDEYVKEYASKTSPVIELPDNKIAVVDALIYNREELKKNMKTCTCTNDSELLTEYIVQKGPEALAGVNGDFAGVIYDKKNKTFTVFRDHMGVRPLFIYSDGNSFVFSTDIRGIISQKYTKLNVSDDWIIRISMGKNPCLLADTEYREISCAAPGAYSVYSVNESGITEILQTAYWRPGRKKIRMRSEKEYARKLNHLITEAIRKRIAVCPGRIGAELSGGIDSGVISILINRLGEKAKYYSWSVSPEEADYVEGDERLVIRDICEQENFICEYSGKKIEFGESSDIYRESKKLPAGVTDSENIQEKYCFPAYSNTGSICDTAKFMRENGVKLVFTGHGGDEGVSHRMASFEIFHKREYLSYFRHMWGNAKGSRFRLKRTLGLMKRDLKRGKKLLSGEAATKMKMDGVLKKSYAEKHSSANMGKKYFNFDAKAYVENGGSRNRLDNVALYQAYSNVRYTAPFLDYNVIDFALSIPRHLYLKNGMDRYIFRQAFKEIMPESLYKVTDKRTKSMENVEPDYDEWISDIEYTFSRLNRDMWADIIDFDFCERTISELKAAQKKDRIQIMIITYILNSYFAAQFLPEKLKA